MYFSRREDPISSPKTQARVQLGSKVDRLPDELMRTHSASVTIGGLMMRIPTHRASGRDREEWQRLEGWCLLCHP